MITVFRHSYCCPPPPHTHTKVTGPDNKVIYSGERESSGKYAFAAHMNGVYKYCFGNQMSSMTPKTVMFGFDLSETAQDSDGVCVCMHVCGYARLCSSFSHQLSAILESSMS